MQFAWPKGRCDLPKRRAVNICQLRVLSKVNVIQEIKGLESELYAHLLGKLDALKQRSIDVEIPRPVYDGTSNVASAAGIVIEKYLPVKRGPEQAVTARCLSICIDDRWIYLIDLFVCFKNTH